MQEAKKTGLAFLPTDPPKNTADPAVSNPQIDRAYTDAALAWAASIAHEFKCPICGNAFVLSSTDEGNNAALMNHLETQHFARVMVGYSHKNLDAMYEIARDEAEADQALFETVGLDVDAEAGEHYNSFEVPADIRKKFCSDGGRLHWAHPRNLIRYKRRGMEVIGGLAADGTIRGPDNQLGSQELILMRIPPRLAEQRDRIKARNVDNAIDARQEDRMGRVNDIQRRTHDALVKRGASAETVRNVVEAVGRGLERGTLRIKNSQGSKQYTV